MTIKQGTALISLCALLMMFTVGLAEGADGTLKVAFKYKDPPQGLNKNCSPDLSTCTIQKIPLPWKNFIPRQITLMAFPIMPMAYIPKNSQREHITFVSHKEKMLGEPQFSQEEHRFRRLSISLNTHLLSATG